MDAIELTESETTMLRDVVQSSLTELHTEISHTDDRVFKTVLRRRQELLRSALTKLASATEQTG